MPIYAYRCDECGFAKDVLQKMSDAPLTQCLSCGANSFRKQVTAAGFQLKGSGWYVTDFRGGGSSASNGNAKPANQGGEGGAAAKSSDSTGTSSDSSSSTSPAAGA